MLNSTILDVMIGMVFCFASVALFVSALNEGIASLLKLRHAALLTGIKQMLNDPHGTGLALQLYNHALVNPLATPVHSQARVDRDGKTTAPPLLQMPGWSSRPAYIPSEDFASALLDVLSKTPNDIAAVSQAVDGIADPQLKQLLQGCIARAGTDIDALREHIASWFDNAMNRLSGSYKRQSQLITLVLGMIAAVALNIDAFHVLDQLWRKPSLAASLSSHESAQMIQSMAAFAAAGPASGTTGGSAASAPLPMKAWDTALGALPVGWDGGPTLPSSVDKNFYQDWAMLIAGWFVTATASVFGAPFWFDILQRLVQVRGTGAKPRPEGDTAARATTVR